MESKSDNQRLTLTLRLRTSTHPHDNLAADLIDTQAAEIVRHRANAAESVGLAGERIGTIAALRHEVADQADEIARLNKAVQRTADGEIPELTVWWPGAVEVHHGFVQRPGVRVTLGSSDVQVAIGECYSTPELAETVRLAELSAVQETKQDG